MYTINKAKQNIVNKINRALGKKTIQASDLVLPPDSKMGDFSFACFNLSKDLKKDPAKIAQDLASKIKTCSTVKSVEATGPYLNFKLQYKKLTKEVLAEITKQGDKYGEVNLGKKKKILVEFACPNTHKAFHIGHLRNIITGESLIRILENANYKVTRVNYQGDVGMHIAKCIWGITKKEKQLKKIKTIAEKIKFLSDAYAYGSKNYEKSKKIKAEIDEINIRIYENDKSIRKIYQTTRKWSLQYFDKIYQRLDVKFNRFYFESETFALGKKIVLEYLKKGVFKESDGAIIFEGAKHGLHSRVFINSQGYPTYEAKDIALAKLQFKEHNPAKIIHIVGPEQTEYFKVIFKALENILPASKDREMHLPYGWVSLKGMKMSSRLGNVVLGEWLLDEVKQAIRKIVAKNKAIKNPEKLSEQVSLAAVKYSFLKSGRTNNIVFDLKESVSTSGNSGPYLQYTYARINSILKKSKTKVNLAKIKFDKLTKDEENLIFKLSLFSEIAGEAAEKYEPSLIAKYLFELAQIFNDYYHSTPILKAEKDEREFRLALISTVASVLDKGVELLGFETVDKM